MRVCAFLLTSKALLQREPGSKLFWQAARASSDAGEAFSARADVAKKIRTTDSHAGTLEHEIAPAHTSQVGLMLHWIYEAD